MEKNEETKFCGYCGEAIPEDAVFCCFCGEPTEEENTVCGYCGKDNPPGAVFCCYCGKKLAEEENTVCGYCGEDNPPGAVFCCSCGEKIAEKKNNSNKKNNVNSNSNSNSNSYSNDILKQPIIFIADDNTVNKNINPVKNINPAAARGKLCEKKTALLLCIFLGFYGAHKFYEGKIEMGLLYLFTFGLFFIGWIVDIITIATEPEPFYYA